MIECYNLSISLRPFPEEAIRTVSSAALLILEPPQQPLTVYNTTGPPNAARKMSLRPMATVAAKHKQNKVCAAPGWVARQIQKE
jgi:hypothetical protein